jgi:hypothetical protein
MKSIKFVSTLLLLFVTPACSTFAGKEEVGAVIARRAQVRSSSAVVAADLKEVVRGDELDIMDSVTVPDTGERWLHVRTRRRARRGLDRGAQRHLARDDRALAPPRARGR